MRPFARRVGAKPMQGFRKLVDVPITMESTGVETLNELKTELENRGIAYRVHGCASPQFAWRVWVQQRDLCIAQTIVRALEFQRKAASNG